MAIFMTMKKFSGYFIKLPFRASATGLLLLVLLLSAMGLDAQNKERISRKEYIKTYAELAMKEMERVGIPASITLAQGCLESGDGNSTLARKAKNHFGIKCHDWTGRKVYHDDDKKNECFRAYSSPYESFKDHSEFLSTRGRYSFLFDLDPHDYRGWSKGLKKAGYATAPNYATLLIRIIEDNELYRYDLQVLEGGLGALPDTTGIVAEHSYKTDRPIRINNRIEYVLTEPGDTPESLRRELSLYKNEIYRYNDLYKGIELETGTKIYLQPKRRKAARGNEIHRVKEGETMYDISQLYGVKLKHLYRKNHMMEGEQPLEGTDIYLRRTRREPLFDQGKEEEDYVEEEMQFRFDR